MILARHFVDLLAEVTGLPESNINTVNKVLAEAGLRQKSSGRAHPNITTIEGLRILLGVLGAPVKTKSASFVRDVEKFTFQQAISGDETKLATLPNLTGMNTDDLKELPLIAVLEKLAHYLSEREKFGNEQGVWLAIDQGGYVELQVRDGPLSAEFPFIGVTDHKPGDACIRASVSHHTLRKIAEWTKAED